MQCTFIHGDITTGAAGHIAEYEDGLLQYMFVCTNNKYCDTQSALRFYYF
jgi:hypothetical protein